MKFWAIKHNTEDRYFSTAAGLSSVPTIYLTKGRAEGRRKQFRRDNWRVVEWEIIETAIED